MRWQHNVLIFSDIKEIIKATSISAEAAFSICFLAKIDNNKCNKEAKKSTFFVNRFRKKCRIFSFLTHVRE